MEHTRKETYFRDVYFFIERAKNLALVKGGELVCNNLWTCFQGLAFFWWTGKLFDNEKRIVQFTSGPNDLIGEWTYLLYFWFKESSNIALEILTKERYTLCNASNRRKSREYTQKIVWLAKDASLDSLQN